MHGILELKQMPTQPDKPARRTKKLPPAIQQVAEQQEPPPFSETYHKAHKSYLTFSALLLAWAAIDIRVETIDYLKFIGNAKAIPVVLSVLVAYSGIKLTIEWLQSNDGRRKTRPSQLDFWLSHWVGVFSIILYLLFQETARAFGHIDKLKFTFENFIPVLLGGTIAFWLVFVVLNKTSDYIKSPIQYWVSRFVVVLLLSPVVLFSTLGPDIESVQRRLSQLERYEEYKREESLRDSLHYLRLEWLKSLNSLQLQIESTYVKLPQKDRKDYIMQIEDTLKQLKDYYQQEKDYLKHEEDYGNQVRNFWNQLENRRHGFESLAGDSNQTYRDSLYEVYRQGADSIPEEMSFRLGRPDSYATVTVGVPLAYYLGALLGRVMTFFKPKFRFKFRRKNSERNPIT